MVSSSFRRMDVLPSPKKTDDAYRCGIRPWWYCMIPYGTRIYYLPYGRIHTDTHASDSPDFRTFCKILDYSTSSQPHLFFHPSYLNTSKFLNSPLWYWNWPSHRVSLPGFLTQPALPASGHRPGESHTSQCNRRFVFVQRRPLFSSLSGILTFLSSNQRRSSWWCWRPNGTGRILLSPDKHR